MKRGIVAKLILSIIALVLSLICIELTLHNFFVEDIYCFIKKQKIHNNLREFVINYEKENWDEYELEEYIMSFSKYNEVPLLILDEQMKVLNEDFFKSFNYITIKTENSEFINVIVDFLVDEQGNIKYENLNLKEGENIEISGIKVKDTSWVEPMEINYKGKRHTNGTMIDIWKEFHEGNEKVIQSIVGEVVHTNYISRNKGTLSYQENKLWREVRIAIEEAKNDSKSIEDLMTEEKEYIFIEEESGLKIVLQYDIVRKKDGRSEYVITLFTLENIRNIYSILKPYIIYYYIIALFLIVLLAYAYTKWLTKPLLHINKIAKRMAELDFSTKLEIESQDELQELGESLNKLSENLSDTIDKLKKSNKLLADEAYRKSEEEKRMRNLLANVSHEFKTPLGIISGFVEIIKDGVNEKSPEYYLNSISDEVYKLNSLVKETIELSKLESGNCKLNLESFNIGVCIQKVCEKFCKHFLEKNLVLHVMVKETQVIGDYKKIEQVLKNLISNAVKYSGKGEKVTITTEVFSKKVIVRIRNTGVTLNQEDMYKIWDRFYRGEKSRNRLSGGSGLGLAIVKNILCLHQSEFGVENVDEGVEFYFSLNNNMEL